MSMLLHLRATVYGREIRHISTLLHGCSYNTPRMGPYRISAKILNGLFLDVTGRGLRKLTPHCNVFSVVLKHPSANRQLPWLLLSCAAKMFIISRNRLCLFGRSQYWVCWTSPWQIETNLHFAHFGLSQKSKIMLIILCAMFHCASYRGDVGPAVREISKWCLKYGLEAFPIQPVEESRCCWQTMTGYHRPTWLIASATYISLPYIRKDLFPSFL